MKKILLSMHIIFFLATGICQAKAPHQVAGFVLGAGINDYMDRIRTETSMPIRHSEYLNEVEIKPLEGFKSGLIWYGVCNPSKRIVRIKLKYADPSKAFFQELLKRYKKIFGEPTEWRGDPFHIFTSWKWSFTDDDHNRISLILHHNTRDLDRKIGNCVKLTMWNLFDEELQCFKRKHSDRFEAKENLKNISEYNDAANWERLIPR